ncbi:MAG: HAD family hydrolase [Thermoplasmata archaeon]
MAEIKIIVFDYDRVLTDYNLNFDYRLESYFEDLKKRNILVGINTGRRWEYIKSMAQKVNFIIYENGYFYFEKFKVPLFNDEDREIALFIKEKIKNSNMECIEGEMITSCPIEYFEKLRNIFTDKKIKLVKNIDRVMVLPINIDKGKALKKVLNFKNLNGEHLCVIGDGENDIDMFYFAGLPGSINNSVDSLKRISKIFSPQSYSDGTLDILEKLKNMNYKY